MQKFALAAIVAVLAFYGLAAGLLTLFQRRLIYHPDTTRPDIAAAGLPDARAITVRTQDGLDLLAWYAPPADPTQPVVLYLHGNGGNIGYRARRLARLHGFGWGVLLAEYRGYGGNPGSPSEEGLIADARAAYAALRGMDVPARRILLWGESLGSGVAVRLAGEVEVGAVLLEAPYTSIAAIAKRQFRFMPVDWLLRDRFDLIGRIGAIHAPLLVMGGGRDDVVPPWMGEAVFAAAAEPKSRFFAPDAGHNDLAEAGALTAAREFVARAWHETP